MAVMRKKGGRELPTIATSSLPDVVYMMLLFFMLTTSMRDQEVMVQYKLPTATETQKLEDKTSVSHIHIGSPILPLQAKFGAAPRIQLNDSFSSTRDILDFVSNKRNSMKENAHKLIVNIKADEGTKMGIINDVKQELRRANALNVSYGAINNSGM